MQTVSLCFVAVFLRRWMGKNNRKKCEKRLIKLLKLLHFEGNLTKISLKEEA